MKGRTFFGIIVGAFVLSAATHSMAVTVFHANLTPEQVIPNGGPDPDGESARGVATLTLNDAMDKLTYFVQFFNVDLGGQTPETSDDIQAIHIHNNFAGLNGPHVLNIFGQPGDNLGDNDGDVVVDPIANTISGMWTDADATADQSIPGATKLLTASMDDLFAGKLYFQLHSEAFPSSENTGILRGQIDQVPEPVTAMLGLMGLSVLGITTRRRVA